MDMGQVLIAGNGLFDQDHLILHWLQMRSNALRRMFGMDKWHSTGACWSFTYSVKLLLHYDKVYTLDLWGAVSDVGYVEQCFSRRCMLMRSADRQQVWLTVLGDLWVLGHEGWGAMRGNLVLVEERCWSCSNEGGRKRVSGEANETRVWAGERARERVREVKAWTCWISAAWTWCQVSTAYWLGLVYSIIQLYRAWCACSPC